MLTTSQVTEIVFLYNSYLSIPPVISILNYRVRYCKYNTDSENNNYLVCFNHFL